MIMLNNIKYINLIGIHIYLLLFLKYCSFLPLLIYVNGVLCHTYGVNNKIIVYYDIIINVVSIIYVNIKTSWQYYTLIISLYGLIVFIIKDLYVINDKLNQIIHVTNIHIPFSIAMYNYIK